MTSPIGHGTAGWRGNSHRYALERADNIIGWMASYLGRMAPPSNGIYDLNEHWLYMGQLRHAEGKKPRRGPWKAKTSDDRPLDQKPHPSGAG